MKNKILKYFKSLPQIAIITGSGINLFKNYNPIFSIRYNDIPELRTKASSSIKGHNKKLYYYKINNIGVLVFSGRNHLYQGCSFEEVVSNIKFIYSLKIKNVLITNAAGGINTKLKAGDLMLITGYVDMIQSNERGTIGALHQKPEKVSTKLNKKIKKVFPDIFEGTYCGMLGPNYETYSEIELLKSMSGSAVGMSTIPELITSHALNLNFSGISIISNKWSKTHKPSHEEVLRNVEKANNKLENLVLKLIDSGL